MSEQETMATGGVSTRRRQLVRAALCTLLLGPGLSASAAPDDELWDALQRGGLVVLLRHAITTPGVGDPPGFKLDDCSTQRNLSAQGREDARKVGEAFRAHRIPIDRVLSSPWCRCIETARIAFDATPENYAPLSNLFGRAENRDKQVEELTKLVSDFGGRGNLVMVSHGSTILALTGVAPDSAEMVLVKPEGSGKFSVRGRLVVR
jgi:broad specificity phosphatase PhoE